MVLICVKPRLLEIRTEHPGTGRGRREAGHDNHTTALISAKEILHRAMIMWMVKISQLIPSFHCKICHGEKADY